MITTKHNSCLVISGIVDHQLEVVIEVQLEVTVAVLELFHGASHADSEVEKKSTNYNLNFKGNLYWSTIFKNVTW